MNEKQFIEGLSINGVFLDDKQEKQFRKYFELLHLWNQKIKFNNNNKQGRCLRKTLL